MYDSVFVLVEAFNRIIRKKPDQFRSYTMRRQNGAPNTTAKFLECNTSKGWVTQWEHGERIAKNLRKVEVEGLTGDIRFNDEGKRINYTLHVVEMTVNSAMVKVAEWSDVSGITPVLAKYTRIRNHEIEKNKTYVITTMIEEPYMMLKQQDLSGKVLEGNEKYEGYCKDLAELIAKQLDINCKMSRLWLFFRAQ
jgi:glutamate receptor, ionotropic, invertebrate